MIDETDDVSDLTEEPVAMTDENLIEFYSMILPSHTPEDIGEALQAEKNFIGEKELAKAIVRYGSYTERLIRMLDTHTDQTVFTQEALKLLKDMTMVGSAYEHIPESGNEDDKGFILKNRILTNLKSRKGAEVTGKDARLLILAGNKNIKRVNLYNSGFLVILRGPSLLEINLVYNQLNESMNEYGRILGAVFFMHSDAKIKAILWNFIESLVIDSNLIDWDKNDRLRDNMSFADYHTVLLGILSLMYKNGYPFIHMCLNPDCKHQIEASIDLSLLQLTDFSRIPHAQMVFLAKAGKVEPEDLIAYKKALAINDSITIGCYKIHRRVPSVSMYLQRSESFNEEMRMSIHDIKDDRTIQEYLNFNYVRIFEPWIAYVEVLGEDGEISYKVLEEENIALILSQIQSSEDNEEFIAGMQLYTKQACLTLAGYAFDSCPVCKQEPSNKVNGFIPFDVQNSFFSMAVRMLLEKSSRPSKG